MTTLFQETPNMKLIRAATASAAILLSLAWGQAATAATYYVNPVSGNDANNGTTVAQAVKTMNRAGDLAVAGDTVKLMQGHYQIVDGNGKPYRNITLG
ncbi:MAG: hypothetical protein LC647_17240, partial [Beggiatoa sp.]|nr:hypothetical protein [Beggiatoa sp.]